MGKLRDVLHLRKAAAISMIAPNEGWRRQEDTNLAAAWN